MPVFINEVVFRGDLQREKGPDVPAAGLAPTSNPATRDALAAEVAQMVIERLERELDRLGER